MPTDANSNRHAHAGKTILEGIWEQADFKYADLMEMIDAGENWDAAWVERVLVEVESGVDVDGEEVAEQIIQSAELRGLLRGMSYCIAHLINPYEPDVAAVKEQLGERYEDAEEDED